MSLLLQHSIVGRPGLTNFEFDPDKPYRACLLCGVVYQTSAHRHLGSTFLEQSYIHMLNEEWARKHAKTHPEREHRSLKRSGHVMTPEAAHKLAPYGLAPLSDMVLSDEHAHATGVAPRAPLQDAHTY